MAEPSQYSWVTWSISYAPDPDQPKKFKKVGEYLVPPKRYKCEWCKSSYSFERENCPNCGGPRVV